MSLDISVKPDFSKVRYNRKVQKDNIEWEERDVAIYESTYNTRDDHTDLKSRDGGPHTENHPLADQRRPFRAAAFCLGVLCFVMITGVIFLYICYVSVTLEKDQLQARYDKLYNNYSELQGQISDMAVNRSQLQDEVKQLKNKTEGMWCPEGWTRFGCSCYRKFNGEKTWADSRWDCFTRGANLVIINNKEEQTFVVELMKNKTYGDSWIGLWATQKQTGWEWEWVDNSPLMETFWAPGLPLQHEDQYPAVCCDQQGKWTQSKYDDNKNWICEKNISCFSC